MPRHHYKKNTTENDTLYNSYEVSKLINYIMYDGKKNVAENIVYTVLANLNKDKKKATMKLKKAIANVSPKKEVRPRRLGGASYLVPVDVREERKLYLALKWIIDAARSRSNKEFHTFAEKLTAELDEASKNQGKAVEKRNQTEKVAQANKAFSHLKW